MQALPSATTTSSPKQWRSTSSNPKAQGTYARDPTSVFVGGNDFKHRGGHQGKLVTAQV